MRETRALAARLLLVGVVLVPWAVGAREIVLETIHPLRGESQSVVVEGEDGPVAGAIVTVTYRPNSATSRTADLPPTDAAGLTAWTPEDAGIVTLAAATADGTAIATTNAAVRFGGMPGSGLAVMLLAGGLLFGGVAVGFFLLLQDPAHIPELEPPST